MDKTTNSINWFEIPALDIGRGKKFYETILGITMDDMNMDDSKMAFFPWEAGSGKATGAVVQSPNHKPSVEGTIVYLNGNPDLAPVLARVEAAGGQVTVPKTSIGEHGHIAFFIDTEGNNVGLHSNE